MTGAPPNRLPFYFTGGWFRMGVDEPQFSVQPEVAFEFHNSDKGSPPLLAADVYVAELADAFADQPLWLAAGIEPQ